MLQLSYEGDVAMKFNINKIEYDVEVFENNNSSILHFYKEELEPKESSNLTIAHSGYGYIIVRRIDENQTILISGYLNSNIFNKKMLKILLILCNKFVILIHQTNAFITILILLKKNLMTNTMENIN